jgi:hypothetical protein
LARGECPIEFADSESDVSWAERRITLGSGDDGPDENVNGYMSFGIGDG